MRVCLTLILATLYASNALADQCQKAEVLLVVDRSRSMLESIDGQTKWEIARTAIRGIVEEYGEEANFGLMVYPGPSGNGEGGVSGVVPACEENGELAACTEREPHCSTGEILVSPMENNPQSIIDTLFASELDLDNTYGDAYTPTWQSLRAAGDFFEERQEVRKVVILITDGFQCCGLCNLANNDCPEERYLLNGGTLVCRRESENFPGQGDPVAAQAGLLYRDGAAGGVSTYVVGFAFASEPLALHNAAIAGGTPRQGCNQNGEGPNDCYYDAQDLNSLNIALNTIARDIQAERCNGFDDDCDNTVDEGVENACGSCGPVPQEICDATDNDCDEQVDEGACNRCGQPGPDPEEICNGSDDDCDNLVDEGVLNACGECGALPPEICDTIDNDCDGNTDEGLTCDCEIGESRSCYPAADASTAGIGVCQAGQQVCLSRGDALRFGACMGAQTPAPDTCARGDRLDNDCDGQVDEAGLNGCGACGPSEPESCNEVDDDCDGRVDEGTLNRCGRCGQEPVDICNGADDDCDGRVDEGSVTNGMDTCSRPDSLDNDCDGRIDEDGRNGCGQCAPNPAELCNAIDDDCDGRIDEGSLCPTGNICQCGGCAPPCMNGECSNGAMCVDFYCVVDNCPQASYCREGICQPGQAPMPPPMPMAIGTNDTIEPIDPNTLNANRSAPSEDGCGCDFNTSTMSNGLWLAPVFLLGVLSRRRRKKDDVRRVDHEH